MRIGQPQPDQKEFHNEWMHERSLLTQRLSVFLLANSILFLGFVGLVTHQSELPTSCLQVVVCGAGIITSFLLVLNSLGPKKHLENLDEKLGRERVKGIQAWRKGRNMGFLTALLFLSIWVASLKYVLDWGWCCTTLLSVALFGTWLFLVFFAYLS